jgi:hypothetical protein
LGIQSTAGRSSSKSHCDQIDEAIEIPVATVLVPELPAARRESGDGVSHTCLGHASRSRGRRGSRGQEDGRTDGLRRKLCSGHDPSILSSLRGCGRHLARVSSAVAFDVHLRASGGAGRHRPNAVNGYLTKLNSLWTRDRARRLAKVLAKALRKHPDSATARQAPSAHQAALASVRFATTTSSSLQCVSR